MCDQNEYDFSKLVAKDDLNLCELHMIDGKVFKCHKSVLSDRSPVFQSMFKNEMEENRTSIVKIGDIDSSTMKLFLRFIYRLEVKESKETTVDLTYVAEKYLVKDITRKCVKNLIWFLCEENAVETLKIAEMISNWKLYHKCLNFIAHHFIEVNKTPEWKALDQSTQLKIKHRYMRFYANDLCESFVFKCCVGVFSTFFTLMFCFAIFVWYRTALIVIQYPMAVIVLVTFLYLYYVFVLLLDKFPRGLVWQFHIRFY